LYLEKPRRLALHWRSGEFEVWDTQYGRRLGRVERLSRPACWCVASPDESAILTADQMPDVRIPGDAKILREGFIATTTVWDAKSGMRRHTIGLSQPDRDPLWAREWYPRWLDDSHVLLVRLWRENADRAASWLQLVIMDTAAGRIVRVSERLRFAGEQIYLSPDRTLAFIKDNNYVRRTEDGGRLSFSYTNVYSRSHVVDLQTLKVASSWREPQGPYGSMDVNALIGRWCPDSKAVLTVADDRCARLWDARSGRLLRTFAGHRHCIVDAALTGAGDKLLTASEDRTIRIWDTREGKLEAVLAGHAAGLNRVIVLPGDKLAVSAAEEPVAKVWELATGKLKLDLPGHDSGVREVEVVSDTVVRTITHRGTATTWDCSTGMQLQILPKPSDFPKRYGACELVEESGTLRMRIVSKRVSEPKR
jgi:hypothetical protein